MVQAHGLMESINGRIRYALLAGAASVAFLFIAAESDVVAADWLTFPGIVKPKGATAPNGTTKTARSINALLDEARAAEKEGQFDRALIIAERARRLADISARGKPENDVMYRSATTYVNQLKQKKGDEIAAQAGMKSRKRSTVELSSFEPKSEVAQTPPQDQTSVANNAKSETLNVKSEAATVTAVDGDGNDEKVVDRPVVVSPEKKTSVVTTPADPMPKQPVVQSRPQTRKRFIPSANNQANSDDDIWDSPLIGSTNHQQSSDRRSSDDRRAESAIAASKEITREPPVANPAAIHESVPEITDAAEATGSVTKTRIPLRRAKKPLTVEMIMASQVTELPPSPSPLANSSTADSGRATLTTDAPPIIESAKIASEKPKIKIRHRFTARDLEEEPKQDEIAGLPVPADDGPSINPMDKSLPYEKSKTPNELLANDDTTPIQSAEEDLGLDESSLAMSEMSERTRVDQSVELEKDPFEDDASNENVPKDNEFPAEQVRELKDRLDSIAALQPGAILTNEATDRIRELFEEDSESDKDGDRPFVTLRRSADDTDDRPAKDEEKEETVTASSTRTPIIGTTTFIRWRASTDESNNSRAWNDLKSKADMLPSDLRQSSRDEHSFTESPRRSDLPLISLPSIQIGGSSQAAGRDTVELSSNAKGNRPQLRGSLWDNATAPSIEGYSGTVAGSSGTGTESNVETKRRDWLLAPPTPDSSVEQTSFDHPRDSQNHRQDGDLSSIPTLEAIVIPMPLSATTADWSDSESEPGQPIRHSWDSANADESETEGSLTVPPLSFTDKLELIFGVSGSGTSVLYGALGLALVVAGLWVVRSMARADRS